MTFEVRIDCDNDAFAGNALFEISRILIELAADVKAGSANHQLLDINGNRCGQCCLIVDEEE